jgi:hypothetical protein
VLSGRRREEWRSGGGEEDIHGKKGEKIIYIKYATPLPSA